MNCRACMARDYSPPRSIGRFWASNSTVFRRGACDAITRRRYSRLISGDRVSMEVCRTGPGCYQYTAVDDCCRYIVVGLFPRRTGANTLHFLVKVTEEM